jgi:environmental stress-induced protein Ves
MPWKNGGGTTTEIAVHPQRAGLDDFDWRISMASVESDGPFSLFPGVDRTLSVLHGEGMVLTVAGRPTRLFASSVPESFAADVEASARLIGGPITDLNVMTRRGRFEHQVNTLEIEGALTLNLHGDTLVMFCRQGRVEVSGRDESEVLEPLDAIITSTGKFTLKTLPTASLVIISIDPVGAA